MAKIFGFKSTTDEVLEGVNLFAKRVLITGVSAGLGVETARAVAAHGGTVAGPARDLQKARRALAAALPPGAPVELVEADLASLSSVRNAANELLKQAKPLDVIIANAGVMACPQGKTADGFETQFGTNHLGHFVFVNKLVPLLKPGGRIVTLSSAGHQISDIDWLWPFQDREHSLCGRARPPAQGRGIRAASLHPGAIQTELGRHMTPELRAQIQRRIASSKEAATFQYKTVPQGHHGMGELRLHQQMRSVAVIARTATYAR